jgi:hypothetical protein
VWLCLNKPGAMFLHAPQSTALCPEMFACLVSVFGGVVNQLIPCVLSACRHPACLAAWLCSSLVTTAVVTW